MGRVCCIIGCPSPGGVVYHKFPPSGSALRSAWLSAVRLDAVEDSDVFCSLHFNTWESIYTITTTLESSKVLQPGITPSIFPWTTSSWAAVLEIASKSASTGHSSFLNSSSCTPPPSLSPDPSCSTGLPEGEAVQLGSVASLGISEIAAEDLPDTRR